MSVRRKLLFWLRIDMVFNYRLRFDRHDLFFDSKRLWYAYAIAAIAVRLTVTRFCLSENKHDRPISHARGRKVYKRKRVWPRIWTSRERAEQIKYKFIEILGRRESIHKPRRSFTGGLAESRNNLIRDNTGSQVPHFPAPALVCLSSRCACTLVGFCVKSCTFIDIKSSRSPRVSFVRTRTCSCTQWCIW